MAGDDPSMTVLRGLLLIRVEALCGLALEAEIVDGSALVHCNEHRLGNRLHLGAMSEGLGERARVTRSMECFVEVISPHQQGAVRRMGLLQPGAHGA